MNSPLVSIIIPCYNCEEFIVETVRSALSQTYSNCEIIVIDDGSTDNSLEVIKTFGRRVFFTATENRGGPSARNTGLDLAKGEYIQFLDADDLISPNKIESQLKQLTELEPGYISVSNAVYFEHGSDPLKGKSSMGYPELNSDKPSEWLIALLEMKFGNTDNRWGMVPQHAYLTPRSCIDAAGPWKKDLSIDQDGEFFARVITKSNGIRWEPSSYAYYRKFQTRKSVSTRSSKRQHLDLLKSIQSKIHTLDNCPEFRWDSASKEVIASHYMYVCVRAIPLHPMTAINAFRMAEAWGGYDANRFFNYSPKAQLGAKILSWPAYKAIRTMIRGR